ncbi:MAG TPA: O-antigen ligase domain-containing protein [Phaeodactylibacter sp.]|nr:O-antigen ligase domain-containing protein [Phaeodactylibacter sp.]
MLSAIALMMAYVIASLGFKYGLLVFVVMVGLPMFMLCLFDLTFGLTFILVVSFMVNFIKKYIDVPIGIAQDALVFLMFFTIIINEIRERDWKFANHPLSLWVVIWIIYNMIQGLNPIAASHIAWVYTVRSVAGLILLFFVASYAFKSLDIILRLIKIILILAFSSALYGLKQEWIGFSDTEMRWLYSNPHTLELFMQWGRLRIFSYFSDPTTYGILMAYTAAFCSILLLGPYRMGMKIISATTVVSCLLAMAYAGSRTPVVLIPVGAIFFAVLNFKKEMILAVGLFFVLGTAFMMKSTSNPVIYRIQSAFNLNASKDVVDVRMKNQELIQPFIQRHPFGGGLGSTGLWGRRFSPGTFLSSFDHDSGFVRLAVEVGWVGLILYMIFIFQCLRWGIYYYFRVRDPMIKNLYLAINTVFFMLVIASYPQEAILQLPTSIIFYIFLAAIVRLKDYDENFKEDSSSVQQSNHAPQLKSVS